jgi:hypothetical protein
MITISEHDFVENQRGEIALLLNMVADYPAEEPVLLVSPDELTAYLRRNVDKEFFEIIGVNPTIIRRLREATSVLVFEMKGEDIEYSYAAPTALADE